MFAAQRDQRGRQKCAYGGRKCADAQRTGQPGGAVAGGSVGTPEPARAYCDRLSFLRSARTHPDRVLFRRG
jgi:hypothetical protein